MEDAREGNSPTWPAPRGGISSVCGGTNYRGLGQWYGSNDRSAQTRQIAVARRVRREVNMALDGVGVGVGCRYVLCELLRARGCQSGCDDSLQGKIGGSTRAYERRTRPLIYGVTKDVKETGKV